MRYIVTSIVFILCCTLALAQDTIPRLLYHMSGGLRYGLTSYSTTLHSLPGVPSCCPGYESGSGSGISLQAQYIQPVALENDVCVGVDAGVENMSGTLTTTETETLDDDGVTKQGVFEHSIQTSLPMLRISGIARARVWNDVLISAGIGMGIPLAPTFHQQELITNPQTLLFSNGTKIRNERSGSLPEATSVHTILNIGVGYALPVSANKHWQLIPELRYTKSMSDVIAGTFWSAQTLSIGVALQFCMYSTPPPPPPPVIKPDTPKVIAFVPPPPPPIKPKTELIKPFELKLTKGDGKTIDTIVVTNIVATTMFSLMHYVFFDSLSTEIPKRYELLTPEQVNSFSISMLEGKGTFGVYYNMLNMIGYRMRNTKSKITLIGCNSNTDTEKNNLELSKGRAESVKKYLTDVWGIAPERIQISARNLPETPSNPVSQYGIEENRRVEIQFEELSLFTPTAFQDTTRTLNNLNFGFTAGVECEAGVDTWEFSILQGKKSIVSVNGKDSMPTLLQQQWDERKIVIPEAGIPINGRLVINDKNGNQTVFETKPLVVQSQIEQKFILKKFSLIVFKFKESAVSPLNLLILDMIRSQIESNSIVNVIGHTDIYGNPAYNQKLSEQRALQISKLLKLPNSAASGVGGSDPIHDNTLPEGRFYSRTVQINIETPKK